ncbi:MAG: MarR family winged helix-turn-helix transcriptional regulator [Gammaproteobacteria bacterium]
MQREDLDRNFGFLVHDVARLLRTAFDRRVRDLGLTRSQWWVLTHLFRHDGTTQSELAVVLDLEKASLGRLLDRLEANGWIRREEDARDRRAKRVWLTAEVEPAIAEMRRQAAALRRDALSGLAEQECERFVDALLAVKSNLVEMSSMAAQCNHKAPATKGATKGMATTARIGQRERRHLRQQPRQQVRR